MAVVSARRVAPRSESGWSTPFGGRRSSGLPSAIHRRLITLPTLSSCLTTMSKPLTLLSFTLFNFGFSRGASDRSSSNEASCTSLLRLVTAPQPSPLLQRLRPSRPRAQQLPAAFSAGPQTPPLFCAWLCNACTTPGRDYTAQCRGRVCLPERHDRWGSRKSRSRDKNSNDKTERTIARLLVRHTSVPHSVSALAATMSNGTAASIILRVSPLVVVRRHLLAGRGLVLCRTLVQLFRCLELHSRCRSRCRPHQSQSPCARS